MDIKKETIIYGLDIALEEDYTLYTAVYNNEVIGTVTVKYKEKSNC